MEFRIKIDIRPSKAGINYESPVILIGSCFANEIGRHFENGKLKSLVNPFGVLYNPLSTGRAIDLIMEGKVFSKDDLYFYGNKYLSFYHDTGFSSENAGYSLNKINSSLSEARRLLSGARFLFITFGTARIFKWKENNMPVANCHKIPAAAFTRHLLEAEDIAEYWEEIIRRLQQFNKDLNIVFTVSPVRHLKDGAHGNQVSKSILITAIDKLVSRNNELTYFPSYEIMLDELRDYRFYKKDMLHPSDLAVEYIWDRLRESYFSPGTEQIYQRVLKISEAARHKVLGNDPDELARFKETMLTRISKLKNEYPVIDLGEEEKYFREL